MKVAFITGITGQDGSYLAELLLQKGYTIYGILRRTSLFNTTRIDHIRDKIFLRYGDLTDGAALSKYLHDIIIKHADMKQFEIYNLGAQSHVKISFEIPEYTTQVDAIGTLKLLEIIRSFPIEMQKKVRFYQASTSELYGKTTEIPQNENTPFNPVSPYATAKLYAYYIVNNYRDAYGLFACNGILFNHESKRRGENFVTKKIIDGVKLIMDNKKKCIYLGNVDSKRDWGHAEDYVYGMWLMLQQEQPDDYVLATGKTYTVREFVERSFAYHGKKIRWEGEGLNEVGKIDEMIVIRIKRKYYRPNEVDLLLGDATKAREKLGWEAKYQLDDIIKDMFS
jgi:GDPmannose 4,6-dehydratase